MATVVAGDVIELELTGRLDGQSVRMWTLYYKATVVTDGLESLVHSELLAGAQSIWTDVQDLVVDRFAWEFARTTNVTQNKFNHQGNINPTFGGTDPGEKLPDGVTAVFFARTDDLNRIGHKEVPDVAKVFYDGNQWSAGSIASLEAAAAKYISVLAPVSGNQYDPGVVRKALLPNVVDYEQFVSGFATNRPRQRRSRRRDIGI